MLARLKTALRAWWRRDRWEEELSQELELHVQARADDLERRGLGRQAALRQARLELGSREHYREEARASSGFRWFDQVRQDLRFAIRTMARRPGFVAVVVISLALGVAANTVVFSVVNTLLLRPLPIDRPDEVVFVQPNFWTTLSYPNYRDLHDRNRTFRAMAAFRPATMGLGGESGSERIFGILATGSYFPLLGIEPALGRFFGPEEDGGPGTSPLAVLSHSTWLTRFGGDSAVLERSARLNGRDYRIIGVAPKGFFGTELAFRPEIWVPMAMQPEIEGSSWLDNRDSWNSMVIGRLGAGVTKDQAGADLARIALELAREFPRSNTGLTFSVERPGMMGNAARRPATAFGTGIMLLAILVLLAACANLASLFGARVLDRNREIALRMSIGAGRGRVVRQLVTETLALSLVGGGVGWLIAGSLSRFLSTWQPPVGLPLQLTIDLDWKVFVVALSATVAAALVSALAPIRLAWRVDFAQTLRGTSTGHRSGRWTGREALLAVQVTLAAALVAVCLVSVRALYRTLSLPAASQLEGVSVVGFDLTSTQKSHAEGRALQRRILERVASIPGVEIASYGSSMPLAAAQSHNNVFPSDAADFRPTAALVATYYSVAPGFLSTLGIPLVAGRDFTFRDDQHSDPVAIVNQEFVKTVLGPGDPIGQRFLSGANMPPVRVVGVVPDGIYEFLTEAPRRVLFQPIEQFFDPQTLLVVRSSRPEFEITSEARRVISELDRDLAVYGAGPARTWVSLPFLPGRIATVALSAFALLAVTLAITGIYGMAAYVVSQRIKEIGIRMALGAAPKAVLRFIFGRTSMILGLGSVAGIGLALAATKILASVVFQATPRDPLVLGATAVAMVLVGCGSVAFPARRAISVDPLKAVRSD
jgi:predicted permease